MIHNNNNNNETTSLLLLRTLNNDTSSNNNHESTRQHLNKTRRYLYISHLFAQASEVSWQFSLIMFLAAFTNFKSLLLVSSYGLCSQLSVLLTGAAIGKFIDKSNRWMVAKVLLVVQNLCVVFATCFAYVLLQNTAAADTNQINNTNTVATTGYLKPIPSDTLSVVLIFGVHLLGVTADVLDRAFKVAIEKDWVVVMSKTLATSDNNELAKSWLRDTNVTMKQIDLSCKFMAPAMAGLLMAVLSLKTTALIVGTMNFVSLLVEYACSKLIYTSTSQLAVKHWVISTAAETRHQQLIINKNNNNNNEFLERDDSSAKEPYFATATTNNTKNSDLLIALHETALGTYLKQKTALAGISLSLLYLNVLTFSPLMTAYLVWRGLGMDIVGTLRGISSAVGLLGTVVFHFSSSRISLQLTGLWSIFFQAACLTLCYYSLFVENNQASLFLLIVGVCASRVGLWSFDVSVTQLMQEFVEEDVRGVVGSVQNAMNAFWGLLMYGMGLACPNPSQFHLLVAAGYIAVCVGSCLFGIYVYTD